MMTTLDRRRDEQKRLQGVARRFSDYYYERLCEQQDRPFTRNPALTNPKQFEYFMRAAAIIDHYGASFGDFLAAQLEGLRFVSDGEGLFPRPCHLGSDGAETRYVNFAHAGNGGRSQH